MLKQGNRFGIHFFGLGRHLGKGRSLRPMPSPQSWFKTWVPIFTGVTLMFSVGMGLTPLKAELSQDSERLNLEIKMQQRVEEALGKILAPGQFVVVIRIEPIPSVENVTPAAPKNDDGFYLPGVPVRGNIDRSGEQLKTIVDSLKSENKFQRFIRRIYVTLVLDQSISEDVVSKVRELTRQMLSLDPARGDTLDIQRTAFNKPVDPNSDLTGVSLFQKEIRRYWVLIALVLILFCIMVFSLFMFGPLRGFLNSFLQILPMLKPAEAAARGARFEMGGMPFLPPGYLPPNMSMPSLGGPSPASFSGSLQVENPNKTVLPFGFIREDHLGNLAILLSRESPEKAAVVLGYLPPEWITRVLSRMDQTMQTEVAGHLATTRQLLPEQVEDIEQDLKRRLDYLIGGPDRIFAIYESLDAEGQRRMFDNLKETRPEIAEELRRRTVLFEDLDKLESPALKALLREVDLQTIVMSLRGASEAFKNKMLEHVTEGKAEIIREELELGGGPAGKATLDAQKKMVLLAKRLEREGQINIPQIEDSVPTTRYGGSLRSVLKLPPGMKIDDTLPAEGTVEPAKDEKGNDIKDRIKRFLNRGGPAQERYPSGRKEPPAPGSGE